MPNQGILQLWLQRITRFIDIDSLQYSEELCKIVDHVPGLHLWNFSWLDKNLTEDFPLFSIIDDKILQNMQPTISSSEFNVFDQY